MVEVEGETLTAGLRRLSADGASGTVRVPAADGHVDVRFESGVVTGIGPEVPAQHRVPGSSEPQLRAAAVHVLVERLVDAVVSGTAWSWDDGLADDVLPVPAGVVDELSRRSIDAAEALREFTPDTVLRATGRNGETGESGRRLLPALDGTATIGDLADRLTLPVSATAQLAASLVASGHAARVDHAATGDIDGAGAETSQQAVEPASAWDDAEPAAAWDEADTVTGAGIDAGVSSAPMDGAGDRITTLHDGEDGGMTVEIVDLDDAVDDPTPTPASSWAADDSDDGPDQWVMSDEEIGDEFGEIEPRTPAPTHTPTTPTTSTLTSDDAVADDAVHAAWLDELEADPTSQPAAPSTGTAPQPASSSSAAAEFAALLDDFDDVGTPAPPPAAAEPDPEPQPEAAPPPAAAAPKPKPRTGDVSEFLRELSRLALEDDD